MYYIKVYKSNSIANKFSRYYSILVVDEPQVKPRILPTNANMNPMISPPPHINMLRIANTIIIIDHDLTLLGTPVFICIAPTVINIPNISPRTSKTITIPPIHGKNSNIIVPMIIVTINTLLYYTLL